VEAEDSKVIGSSSGWWCFSPILRPSGEYAAYLAGQSGNADGCKHIRRRRGSLYRTMRVEHAL
jgi:hypothetical protein